MAHRIVHRWDQIGLGKWVCKYCKLSRVVVVRGGVRFGSPSFISRNGDVSRTAPRCTSGDTAQMGLLDPERFE